MFFTNHMTESKEKMFIFKYREVKKASNVIVEEGFFTKNYRRS